VNVYDLIERVAIVTGGAQGIGLAVAASPYGIATVRSLMRR